MNKADLLKMPKQTATRKMLKIAAEDKPTIDKYSYGGITYERRSQKFWLYLRCIVDGDILKVSCFLSEPLREKCRTPEYEIYLDRKNRQYLTFVVNENKWYTASFERLPWPGYRYNSHGVILEKQTENMINKFFGTSREGNSILQSIRDFQNDIMRERLKMKHKKQTDPWDEDLKQTRAVPKDWNHWVDKVGIPEQYIFYTYSRKKYKEGYCTYCEHDVQVQPHHNEMGKCPHCHHTVMYKALGKFKYHWTNNYPVYLMQKCKDGFMIREFITSRQYVKENIREPRLCISENRRAIGNTEGKVERAYYFGDYKHVAYRWIKTGVCSYSWNGNESGKIYGKSLPCIAKTYLRKTGLIEMYRKQGILDPEKYLAGYEHSPYIEKFAKAGLTRLVNENLSRVYWSSGYRDDSFRIDRSQTSLTKMLGISTEELRRLRYCNGGKHMLLWLQYEKAIGKPIPDDTIKWMLDNKMVPSDLNFAPSQMSISQIHHYLQRHMREERMNLHETITTWKDYLSMAARLGYDLNDEIIYRVRRLRKRHNELVEILEQQNMTVQAGEILRDFPHVEKNLRAVKATYEYGDKDYTVLVPNCIEDVITEGRSLHHCVDKQERYWDRIERNESYIFFLRRTAQLDKPYYTLEVEPGGTIRQKRTMYDRQEDDIEDAKGFLIKWQLEIKKRLTDRDRSLAEKSRILRLENFKQLQKDNVIINTGHLHGAKLVDVLMADLMVAA